MGETTILGCERFETPSTITPAGSSGPFKNSGKTSITRGSKTTVATTIQRGPTRAFTATTPGDTTRI